ncbi:nuclear transport factor 2 family protein [Streptomyces sp. CB03238]|uniref:nuclear transport factor 2 family protein n=1 Tax=Streptomyces sp. CB03238 TaxID=1907777 RepID=UPI000A0F8F23|nr:nuclear transport factor 2 family protein [Streptomyces sp. CB03238]ORT59405.1 hypothetical protein BKD26_15605 [Streptomyces sp. CB03238]
MQPPEQFIADFFTSFTEQALRDDEDPGHVVDRYFTPDIVQISDGVHLDRDKLVAHLRPLRKNLVAYRFDVHEALMAGDRVAARLTIHGRMRKGRDITTEVHFFGEFTPEGRMRHSHQLTRTLPEGR